MTRIPSLRQELERAAEHLAIPTQSTARWRATSHRTVIVALALFAAIVGSAGAVLLGAGVLGGKPSRPVPRVPQEERQGMKRVREPVLLGVATLSGGRRVELVGYRIRGVGGRGEFLCLDLARPDGSKSGGCGVDIPGRVAGRIGLGDASEGYVVVGADRGNLSAVEVIYRVGDRVETRDAHLMRVAKPVAARVGTRPFTYYLAEVPAAGSTTTVLARDADGRVSWRLPLGAGAP